MAKLKTMCSVNSSRVHQRVNKVKKRNCSKPKLDWGGRINIEEEGAGKNQVAMQLFFSSFQSMYFRF